MAVSGRFSPRRTFIRTGGSGLKEDDFYVLGGLNLYAPDELSNKNDSPYARNFRVFKEDNAESRVTVSKRDGHSFYTVPVGETDRGSITDTTDASDHTIDTINWVAQPFTVSAAGRLTKVTINIKNDNSGTAPLIVKIYSNVDDAPGALLATSSILPSAMGTTYAYEEARFIEAPVVATSTTYWLVLGQQSEATGDYKASTNTSATTALASVDAGNTWTTTTYALNYHVFVSTDKAIKPGSIYRYYRTTAAPVTLFVADTVLYSVNDATGATTSVGTGLNANATDYKFITVEDVVYFVNGLDAPQKFDGTTMSAMGSGATAPGIGIDIALHKNLIFILKLDNSIIWSIEDNTSYEVFETDAIQYIPSPKSGDKAFRMIPFQDNLVFFTKNTKYVLYGYDRATFQLRESTSIKGAVGPNAVWRDESFIYFVSDDSDVYAFNGGTDKSLGIKISRELENAADLSDTYVIVHDGKLRVYYATSGQSALNNCLVYDLSYEQWMLDTEIYCGVPAVFNSQTDNQVLVHGSSLVGAITYAETGTSDLGKPILFDYWTKYYSFDHPSRKHRIKRLYPVFRAGTGPYYVTVGIDTDYANSPTLNYISLDAGGATYDSGALYDNGEIYDGGVLAPRRLTVPGQARRHQIRFTQHGIDNPVDFVGFTTYTKMRRPI